MNSILRMRFSGAAKSHVGGHANGFTLIELMIVVAIIAIILTLALPVYSDYMIRTKVGEALSVGAAAKTMVASTCTDDTTIAAITPSNTGYSFDEATPYIESITLSGPCTQPVISIQTRLTGASPDPIITLTGFLGDGRVTFTCASSGSDQHVPVDCRS